MAEIADTVEKAKSCTVEGNLSTVLDLAGTLAMPIVTLDDVKKMVAVTSQWFVLGRCKPALESFRDGLEALGVLRAVKTNPDSFRPLFCDLPEKLTAEGMEKLFKAKTSPVGSLKGLTESLVLSRWSDYLQDIEEGEDPDITLSDILFFTTGCSNLEIKDCFSTSYVSKNQHCNYQLNERTKMVKLLCSMLPYPHGIKTMQAF